jgi:hypothetical protein
MGIHENSKASILRDYIKENPTATRKQMAEALGFTLDFVRNAIRQDSKRLARHGTIRKPGRPPMKTVKIVKKTSAGVKLNGGYYSLEKLRDIVKALELLEKISSVAKANND